MSACLLWDPIGAVLRAFDDLYPDADCWIQFVERDSLGDAECVGVTRYHDDGSPPDVLVDVALPMEGFVDVLAHELAHVAAGVDADHGPEWIAAYDAIHARVHQAFDDQFTRQQG